MQCLPRHQNLFHLNACRCWATKYCAGHGLRWRAAAVWLGRVAERAAGQSSRALHQRVTRAQLLGQCAVLLEGQPGYQAVRSRDPLESLAARAARATASSSKPHKNAKIESQFADLLGCAKSVARESIQAPAKKSKHEYPSN